jgi:pantoate--beta-alanine ligase
MESTVTTIPILKSRPALSNWVRHQRIGGHTIALVPTMGALHAGHLALIRHAKTCASQVLVSLFVNPTQFGANEDFNQYPRQLERDVALMTQAGADTCFAPGVPDLYPRGLEDSTRVRPPLGLTDTLCGAHRPGHFEGVATVVTKLLVVTDADVAVFGLKDFQQVAVIKALCQDLGLSTVLALYPTVRDPDGVALSSRNRYLSAHERQLATVIPLVLSNAWQEFRSGIDQAQVLLANVHAVLGHYSGVTIQYVSLVDADTLQSVEFINDNTVLAIALFIGTTRLIDNLRLGDALPDSFVQYQSAAKQTASARTTDA